MNDLDIGDLLTRPGTYILAATIWIATFFVRRIVEGIRPSLKKNTDCNQPGLTYTGQAARWWNEVILYALPVLFGIYAGTLQSEFFFGELKDKSSKIMVGLVIGWFSSFLYKLLKKVLLKKAGIDISPGESDAPPAGD